MRAAHLRVSPGDHSRCRAALPMPFLSLFCAFFGLLGFLSPLSHAGSNRRGFGLARGLSWLPARLRANLPKHGVLPAVRGALAPCVAKPAPNPLPREPGRKVRGSGQCVSVATWLGLPLVPSGATFPCGCWVYSRISSPLSSGHHHCSDGSSMGRGRVHLSSEGILHLLVPNPQRFGPQPSTFRGRAAQNLAERSHPPWLGICKDLAGQPKTLLRDRVPPS